MKQATFMSSCMLPEQMKCSGRWVRNIKSEVKAWLKWFHLNHQKADLEGRLFARDRRWQSDSWHDKVITLWMSHYLMCKWHVLRDAVTANICLMRWNLFLPCSRWNKWKIWANETHERKAQGHLCMPSMHICHPLLHYMLALLLEPKHLSAPTVWQAAIKCAGFRSEQKLLIICFDALEVNVENSCMRLHEEKDMADRKSVRVRGWDGGMVANSRGDI